MASGMNSFNMSSLRDALPSYQERISPGENFDRFFYIPVQVITDGIKLSPIQSFMEAQFNSGLLGNIRKADYLRPLPIQGHAIPYIQNGRDVMGHSVTGSGKTAAYILPLLDLLWKKTDANVISIIPSLQNSVMPRAVILLPTRELAIQVRDELVKFAKGLNLKIQLVYGGDRDSIHGSTGYQLSALRVGCDILVATPGRLENFLRRDQISLVKCRYLILDEADRMLDMNFEPAIRFIIQRGHMPPKNVRQTLLFSATYPDSVQKICRDFLQEPIFITIGQIGQANPDIVQSIINTNQYTKFPMLLAILTLELKDIPSPGQPWSKKILAFVQSKDEANLVFNGLKLRKFSVAVIHSGMDQNNREISMNHFKCGMCGVLVATSLAARGLDIKGVDMVVNYSLPQRISEYVQRIGRTGRLGNRGRAISFFDTKVNRHFGCQLLEVLKESQQVIPDWFAQFMGVSNGPRFLDNDY